MINPSDESLKTGRKYWNDESIKTGRKYRTLLNIGGGQRMPLKTFQWEHHPPPLKHTAFYYYCLSATQQVAHKNENDCWPDIPIDKYEGPSSVERLAGRGGDGEIKWVAGAIMSDH